MIKKFTLSLLASFAILSYAFSQDDVMMQAFYWDVPVDAANLNGTWWDNLESKASDLEDAGITGIWVPSPAKGNFGIYDMGYGIFDLYDLGNYNQKGTTETRFGSRTELEDMIAEMHNRDIEVYADIILNHLYTSDSEDEVNPAVKEYVFDEAYRNGQQYSPYPTNEITWVIDDAAPGDYYIQIHGYHLYSSTKTDRGYDVAIDYSGSGFSSNYNWESEPNNGGGNFDVFPSSGYTVRGHIDGSDIDEYKVTVTATTDVIIKLTARKENFNPWEWAWADQTNGYYPKAIWYNGSNIATTSQLEAHTNTGVNYVTHTGTGEANFSWDYSDFHPVDNNDWLGYPGTDEIITNTKFFGNDLNTFSTTVKQRYQDWGEWLVDELEFDGFRMDFVRGFQEEYIADWISNLPLKNGNQRFIVGEYWGPDYRIKNWVNNVDSYGADVDGFDFPLKFSLTDMCNGNGSNYDMRWLNHAGMVRNNSGNSLPGTSVVTWLENHDTGKEHDKWITQDWKMGYAYILTHEGRPCVFYNHFFGDTLKDSHDPSLYVVPASNLDEDISKLIFVRNTYLGGSLEVLSDIGNPYPSGDAHDVYVARRQGNGTKSGAIVVINDNNSSTKGLWVDATPSGWSSWSSTTLVNAFDNSDSTQVYSDGRVWVEAPPRGYAIYVKKSEYVAYSGGSSRVDYAAIDEPIEKEDLESVEQFTASGIYPNPVTEGKLHIDVALPENGEIEIRIIDLNGRIASKNKENISTGRHSLSVDVSHLPAGFYIYKLSYGKEVMTMPFVIQ